MLKNLGLLACFIAVFTTVNWMKQAQPAKSIFLTWTLLMGSLLATPAEPASLICSKSSLCGKYAFLKTFPQIEITVYRTYYNICFVLFLFYLPYLSSIHEKASCIAILWTGSPHSLGSCLFRGLWATCLPHKGGASR